MDVRKSGDSARFGAFVVSKVFAILLPLGFKVSNERMRTVFDFEKTL
jgi:hypothetical protein